MKKLLLIATIFIMLTLVSALALPTPVSAADTDHGGADWTPSGTISGVQFNINTLTITGTVTVSGSVEIHCQTANINGILTATGQGNPADTGTGAGGAGVGAGGGGYGGAGGVGEGTTPGAGGIAYGSEPAPIDMGSGGGSSDGATGGAGGGAIIIHCIGTLTIGTTGAEVIEADGDDGTTAGSGPSAVASGGGSGGSIYISAGTFAGGLAATTHIHADGGDGGNAAQADGGGGGGGRIAIHATTDTYAGLTSAAGGLGPGAAGEGVAGTINTTDDILWRTYKGGYTDDDDVFSDYNTEHTVYVKGTGFPAGDYTIVFWDALGAKIQVDTTLAGPDISSMRTFVKDPADPAGTWYASVYPDGSVPATSHSETANLKADYAFYVYQTAIPEFPTIMAGIGVAGLCFGIYWWMRKRRLAYVKG